MSDAHIQTCVDAIAGELRKQQFDAIRSFWRIGDVVCAFRAGSPDKGWLKALEGCAKCLGMHPSSLDEARRASEAFPPNVREGLLESFERRQASLTPSHIVVLARATPPSRNRGIKILLQAPLSVRELRQELRAEFRDGHRNGAGAADACENGPPDATNVDGPAQGRFAVAPPGPSREPREATMMNESQKQGMESVRAPRRAVRLKAETLRALEIQDPGVPKAFTDLCTDLCTVHCPTMSYCACTTTC